MDWRQIWRAGMPGVILLLSLPVSASGGQRRDQAMFTIRNGQSYELKCENTETLDSGTCTGFSGVQMPWLVNESFAVAGTGPIGWRCSADPDGTGEVPPTIMIEVFCSKSGGAAEQTVNGPIPSTNGSDTGGGNLATNAGASSVPPAGPVPVAPEEGGTEQGHEIVLQKKDSARSNGENHHHAKSVQKYGESAAQILTLGSVVCAAGAVGAFGSSKFARDDLQKCRDYISTGAALRVKQLEAAKNGQLPPEALTPDAGLLRSEAPKAILGVFVKKFGISSEEWIRRMLLAESASDEIRSLLVPKLGVEKSEALLAGS